MESQVSGARAAITTSSLHPIKASSRIDYEQKVTRFLNRARSVNPMEKLRDAFMAKVITEALRTKKASTWQANKAAILFCLRRKFDTLAAKTSLQKAESSESWEQNAALMSDIARYIREIMSIRVVLSWRTPRSSKLRDLKGLPSDWREVIVGRMPKYRLAAAVCALTGCRPAELVTGVVVMMKGEELAVEISGAKVGRMSGQSWRRLFWPIDSGCSFVSILREECRNAGPAASVTIAIENARAFSGAMRAAGQRAWPERAETVTPYCMRHQAAADMKAAKTLSGADTSAALGHRSDATKSTYGRAYFGNRGHSVCPSRVEAACTVSCKMPSQAAIAMSEEITGVAVGDAGAADDAGLADSGDADHEGNGDSDEEMYSPRPGE